MKTLHGVLASSIRRWGRFASALTVSRASGTAVFALLVLAIPATGYPQTITTVAGNGSPTFAGEGVAGTSASALFPSGAAVDATGNVYFADTGNHRVRKIDATTGNVTTVAGNGSMAFAGDTGLATAASLFFPAAVAVDTNGDLYIADTGNNRIRKVTAADGKIATVAGTGAAGSDGDGGLATAATLYHPAGLALDASGNLYLADTFNHRVRVIAKTTGVITTVAGSGTAGYGGDAGAATAAKLNYPVGVSVNTAGTLFVADTNNHRVRSVGGTTINTYAGTGTAGYSGDGGLATAAKLNAPTSIASDASGNLFVADGGNHRIRFISGTGSQITTYVGAGTAGYFGDGSDPSLASMNAPRAVAATSSGGIVVADTVNHRIRAVPVGLGVAMITVAKLGSGTGTITSNTGGIDCGLTCFRTIPIGTAVTLTATPTGGSTFTGWSGGGCSGTGTCVVTLSAATTVTAVFAAPAATTRLVNISTRGQILTGDNVMIGGFIIQGSTPKTVLLRARGPSLIPFGVTGALTDPQMVLVDQATNTVITSNDNWASATNAAAITATGKAPTDSKESAILTTLNPGAYTAVVSGVNSTTGVGIVEGFEVDVPDVQLVNISTRGRVSTGDNVMIAGFIIEGNVPRAVLIRARGPSLIPFGVTNALADPQLTLVNQATNTVIATNDNWGTSDNASAITATGKAPTDSKESAILITLNPGAYTAIVSGVNSTSGVAIVEVFSQ